MKKLIHYMVRCPRRSGGLVYPMELDDKNHYAYGEFVILGKNVVDVRGMYKFHAVRGDRLIVLDLIQDTGSRFAARVDGIGDIRFKSIPMNSPYVGNNRNIAELRAIYRLKPCEPLVLDRAAQEAKFYFVGLSPAV